MPWRMQWGFSKSYTRVRSMGIHPKYNSLIPSEACLNIASICVPWWTRMLRFSISSHLGSQTIRRSLLANVSLNLCSIQTFPSIQIWIEQCLQLSLSECAYISIPQPWLLPVSQTLLWNHRLPVKARIRVNNRPRLAPAYIMTEQHSSQC